MLERRSLYGGKTNTVDPSDSNMPEGQNVELADMDLESESLKGAKLVDITVNTRNDRYPFCIVWTPLPGITTLLPFIGHMGIADSRGVIYDFAGPYTIMEDNLTFGRTSRYIQCINASEATESFAKDWDEAIGLANRVYSNRMHNLCWDNCHSHVKNVLNRIKFRDFNHWNMGILAVW
eukprot:CAMPEP_0184007688 /NCGR_PEP_ID=MMETSP0954-20121128/1498_1 /TAXON_ID=627963 /ORGANISM="Aplanochytrium sp, Strain PBS07" /LENGTH=177 /DNA_ID=CAMNT_0026286597 /DNA_START=407 /DNA_END=937 /DNA_ORIENTATION=+